MREKLTNQQLAIFVFMKEFFRDNDQLPTQTVITEQFGFGHYSNARYHQTILEAKGYIERNALGKYRFKREEAT